MTRTIVITENVNSNGRFYPGTPCQSNFKISITSDYKELRAEIFRDWSSQHYLQIMKKWTKSERLGCCALDNLTWNYLSIIVAVYSFTVVNVVVVVIVVVVLVDIISQLISNIKRFLLFIVKIGWYLFLTSIELSVLLLLLYVVFYLLFGCSMAKFGSVSKRQPN